MKIKIFCLFGLLLVFAIAAGPAIAKDTVGYVSLPRLVQESRIGQESARKLHEWGLERDVELTKDKRRIEEFKKFLDLEGAALSLEIRRKKVEKLQNDVKAFERQREDVKEEFKKKDRGLSTIVLEKAQAAVQKVADKRGYNIILVEPKAIGYLNPKVDITNEVLRELNK